MNELDFTRARIRATVDRMEEIGITIALGFKPVDIDAADLELETLQRRLKRLRQDEQGFVRGDGSRAQAPRATSAFSNRYRSSITLTKTLTD